MSIIRQINRYLFSYRNQTISLKRKTELFSEAINRNIVWKMSSFKLSSVKDLKVEHKPSKHHFFVQLGKDKAVLQYRDVSPGVVDLWHTEVPQELRGKGIAKMLAKEAFDFVVNNNMKMIVSCTYLQKYLKENEKPEYLLVVFETKD